MTTKADMQAVARVIVENVDPLAKDVKALRERLSRLDLPHVVMEQVSQLEARAAAAVKRETAQAIAVVNDECARAEGVGVRVVSASAKVFRRE